VIENFSYTYLFIYLYQAEGL